VCSGCSRAKSLFICIILSIIWSSHAMPFLVAVKKCSFATYISEASLDRARSGLYRRA